MGPPPVHPIRLNQSFNQSNSQNHDNYPSWLPRKYIMSLPRAWISMHRPRVLTGISLRGGHDDRMYKYKQKNARPLQSSLVVNSDFEYLHIKPPINKSKCHALPRRLSIHVSPTARRPILFILILIFVSRQEDMSDAAAWSYMCTLLRYYLVYYGVRSCVRCL